MRSREHIEALYSALLNLRAALSNPTSTWYDKDMLVCCNCGFVKHFSKGVVSLDE